MTKQWSTQMRGKRGVLAACLLSLAMSPGLAFAQSNASDEVSPEEEPPPSEEPGEPRPPRPPRDARDPRLPRNPDQVFELGSATIEQITNAMNSKALTAVELANLYLRRIQAYNVMSPVSPAQPLNAILFMNDGLLDDAAESDRLRKKGVVLGPLHGIPFLVKGSFSIKNFHITGGHNGWADLVTPNETPLVTSLKQAGGLMMGQANMDTWASSAVSSSSQIRGAVRSCYLPGALPGGSSGGSGVSAGAYLTHFTFGGETGGSIRNPGDRNALVAYKVSGGSISVDKIIPLAPERDVVGPMTRAAVDNAIIRDVVGKKDPNDIWSPILYLLEDKRPVPETGFKAKLACATLAGKRIGIIGTYVGMPHPDPTAPGSTGNTTNSNTTTPLVFALVEQAKAEMEALGATVEYVFMPPDVSTTFNRGPDAPVTRLLSAPGSTNVAAYSYRGLIESIVGVPGDDYQTLATKVLATASRVNQISAAVRAAMYSVDPVSGLFIDGTLQPFSGPLGTEHYMAKSLAKNSFEAWMDSLDLDAVAWPMWPNKGPTSGTIIGRDLVNNMFLPGVTVPMGVLQYDAADPTRKEPLTIDFTGRLYDDDNVLAIAYAYEQATHHRYDPPLAPALPGEIFDWKLRLQRRWAKTDDIAPVVTVGHTIKGEKKGAITFNGGVVDKSGIDRVEVSVGGMLLATTFSGKNWTALLPGDAFAAYKAAGVKSVEVLVLAVDLAGNVASVADVVRF